MQTSVACDSDSTAIFANVTCFVARKSTLFFYILIVEDATAGTGEYPQQINRKQFVKLESSCVFRCKDVEFLVHFWPLCLNRFFQIENLTR